MSRLGPTADTHPTAIPHLGRTKELGRLQRRRQESPRRCTGEAGTALVELALLITPLVLLLFGIIIYGYLMSFRQNMTSAAAEGARAGAIAPPDSSPDSHVTAFNQATIATSKALQSFGEDCNNGRTTCDVVILTCPAPSTLKCVTVTVTYDYEHNPLMPDVPVVSSAIPSTFVSKSTAQINQ
jgi:Flp pilus assembly protein TadG